MIPIVFLSPSCTQRRPYGQQFRHRGREARSGDVFDATLTPWTGRRPAARRPARRPRSGTSGPPRPARGRRLPPAACHLPLCPLPSAATMATAGLGLAARGDAGSSRLSPSSTAPTRSTAPRPQSACRPVDRHAGQPRRPALTYGSHETPVPVHAPCHRVSAPPTHGAAAAGDGRGNRPGRARAGAVPRYAGRGARHRGAPDAPEGVADTERAAPRGMRPFLLAVPAV